MGPRMAPPYADLFMGRFEQQTFYNSLLKRSIWCMFIDDIFMIWTHGEEHLKTLIGYLNSIHPSIKFTHEYSNSLHQTLPFPDVQIYLINNHIQTDLHTKPTDKHQFLLKTSCHPKTNQNSHPIQPLPPNPSHIFHRHFSLTNKAENSSRTLPNVVIAAPHFKGMRIVFSQFHVTQPVNRKNRNLPRLTERPLSHPD